MIEKLMKPFNKLYNHRMIIKNHVNIGDNLIINGRIYIVGNNIAIGNNVKLNSGYKFNPIGGQERTMLVTNNNGKIKIGNNVGISNSTIVSHNEITIEDNVMIGGSCKIYDTDFHSIQFEKRIGKYDDNIKTSPITIKKNSFIGAHSIILKGITIGEGSVIGAGSVVTKNVPSNEIWGGNPAKYIKKVEE